MDEESPTEWSDQRAWFMAWAVVAVSLLVRTGCFSLFSLLMPVQPPLSLSPGSAVSLPRQSPQRYNLSSETPVHC